jgi:uncharacterized protein (DUF2237 family)
VSIEGALARGRAAAEAIMVDSCTIRRRTGTTTDLSTGEVTPTYSVLYTGKCRVQSSGNWGEARDVGEAALVLLTLQVQLPIAVVGLEKGDEITIDASVHDPDLVGRVVRIRDLHHKSHATSRRVMCTEVTG